MRAKALVQFPLIGIRVDRFRTSPCSLKQHARASAMSTTDACVCARQSATCSFCFNESKGTRPNKRYLHDLRLSSRSFNLFIQS